MIRPDRISLLTLSLLLAACGGGDGAPVIPEETDTTEEETEVGNETGGLIDQDSFDIAANILNPGAADFNGTEVEITVYAGDRLQNPVPDDTVIYLNAESGIIPATCLTENGTCTVIWRSSGYRPGQEDEEGFSDLERVNELNINSGESAYGLTTIMAYAVGEAGFTDSNDNEVYDLGEPFESFAEPFRDDNAVDSYLQDKAAELDTNDNGLPVEFFADFNQNGIWDDAPDTYQGSRCSDAARAEGHCSTLMYVRTSMVINQSDSNENIVYTYAYSEAEEAFVSIDSLDLDVDGAAETEGTIYVLITDINDSVPTNGTTYSVSATGYNVSNPPDTVGNTNGVLWNGYNNTGLDSSFGSFFSLSFESTGSPESIVISATAGDGTVSSATLRP